MMHFAFSNVRAACGGFAVLALTSVGVFAQDRPKLDVPYVPTPQNVVEKMLDMAQVGPNDIHLDLGSGDGRIAIAAAKRGATSTGVDIDPDRIAEANDNAKKAGVDNKVKFIRGNLFEMKLSDATVLTMYLLERVNAQLRPRILDELKPGTRVVSHAFTLGEWLADEKAQVDNRDIYFWVVPAKVAGQWKVADGENSFTLQLDQQFQRINGVATVNGKAFPVENATLRGTEISFSVPIGNSVKQYRGRVNGNAMEALPAAGSSTSWRASRS
jgi:SAM-dependent methyltransferase